MRGEREGRERRDRYIYIFIIYIYIYIYIYIPIHTEIEYLPAAVAGLIFTTLSKAAIEQVVSDN